MELNLDRNHDEPQIKFGFNLDLHVIPVGNEEIIQLTGIELDTDAAVFPVTVDIQKCAKQPGDKKSKKRPLPADPPAVAVHGLANAQEKAIKIVGVQTQQPADRFPARAKLKVIVKRTLRQYGYPPDMQKLATDTVLQQAELIAEELTAAAVN